jgi:hypothetical protein
MSPRLRTGPDKKTRELVLDRDGYACVRCGCGLDTWLGYSIQHRVARGMGGTSDPAVNSPANLVVLCGSATTGCHGFVESHPAAARVTGFRVDHGTDPATVPIRRRSGVWWLLLDDGKMRQPGSEVRTGRSGILFAPRRIQQPTDSSGEAS